MSTAQRCAGPVSRRQTRLFMVTFDRYIADAALAAHERADYKGCRGGTDGATVTADRARALNNCRRRSNTVLYSQNDCMKYCNAAMYTAIFNCAQCVVKKTTKFRTNYPSTGYWQHNSVDGTLSRPCVTEG